jgi:RNA-binding protein
MNAMSKPARTISQSQRREMIRRGHDLRAQTTLGRQGLTDAFVTQLDRTMRKCDLLKVRVDADSGPDATSLADSLARRIGGELIQRVGRVALIYRPIESGDNE